MRTKLGAALALALIVGPGASVMAAAQSGPFNALYGAWRGSGEIRLEGGQSEQIRCNAYYTQRENSGLGLAIRCASQSYNIELRSHLMNNAGNLTGSWEERNFNAVGDVTGRASPGAISLEIKGGGLEGSMNVSTAGNSQTVSISTQGTRLRSVSIRLSRG